MTATCSYSPRDSASNYTITYEEYHTLALTWTGTKNTNYRCMVWKRLVRTV